MVGRDQRVGVVVEELRLIETIVLALDVALEDVGRRNDAPMIHRVRGTLNDDFVAYREAVAERSKETSAFIQGYSVNQ